jgi:ubiquinone/menaquinone biosynthesis C-methylase UbiE
VSTVSSPSIKAHDARNPFLDPGTVAAYESWYETHGRRAERREKALLAKLLALFPDPRSVLEVGCGTGHFTRWFASRGLQTVGLDISAAMLAEARRRSSAPLVLGDATRLPLRTASCDLAVLITTLEFVEDPVRAVREALRVAKHGVLLGVINGRSRLGRRLKREGGVIWGAAHLYTPAETARIVTLALAGRHASVSYRTTLWPVWPRDLPLPQGGFIGMAVRPGATRTASS